MYVKSIDLGNQELLEWFAHVLQDTRSIKFMKWVKDDV